MPRKSYTPKKQSSGSHTSGSLPSGFRTQTEPPTFLTHESRFRDPLLEVGVPCYSAGRHTKHCGASATLWGCGEGSEECHVPSKGTKLVGVRMRMETEDVQG